MFPIRRLLIALLGLVALTALGTLGYVVLVGFDWLEALCMTVLAISTVGYGEARPLDASGRLCAIVLIIVGVGTTLWLVSAIAELLLEGRLREIFQRTAMQRRIDPLRNHVVVCGFGRVGRAVVDGLLSSGTELGVTRPGRWRVVSAEAAAQEPLPEGLVRDLRSPAAHSHDGSARDGVHEVQTHLSHVFLTGDRVYKLHKAAELSFVHFGTRDLRNEDCLREVRLNRRLAPDVYLGVAPVVGGAGEPFRVGEVAEALAGPGPDGRPPEHVIVMRRLAEGTDARSLLLAGELHGAQLEATAEVLAELHARAGLGCPAPFTPAAWRAVLAHPARANFEALLDVGLPDTPAQDVRAVAEGFEARLEACGADLERRRLEGRAVDGHGDVHLQHVFFEAGASRPVLIDCLAFDAALRHIDAASDVAFLAMDLEYLGHRPLADDFLRAYATASDDFHLFSVVDLYASYRAGVRAKVAALAARDPDIAAEQRRLAAGSASRHLALAGGLLREPAMGALIVICGTVGSGKSSVARTLASATGGVLVSSDRTRKRAAGLAPTERAAAAPGQGLYTEAHGDAVYAGLLERAEPALRSGRTVVLDATYGRAGRRLAAREWAVALGARSELVEVVCDPEVARARLARRAREGTDPSDAGPELLAASRAGYEPPDEWPAATRHRVDTASEGWEEGVRELGAELGLSSAPRAR